MMDQGMACGQLACRRLTPGQIRDLVGMFAFFLAGLIWFACGYLAVVGVGAMVISAAFLLRAICSGPGTGERPTEHDLA